MFGMPEMEFELFCLGVSIFLEVFGFVLVVCMENKSLNKMEE